jgi:outer membrane protein OmpA-like peptidoglycan-associated protein
VAGLTAVAFLGTAGTGAVSHDVIIYADQVTAEEGDDPSPPPGLINLADARAAAGGGNLVLIRGAGQPGVRVVPPVSLLALRQGEVEHDPATRKMDVQRMIDAAFRRARTVPVPGAGRDVLGLLITVSHEMGTGHNDVWLRTLGLPTVNPADARILMAADPAQAVASIARDVPSLRNAQVRLILAPPAGPQQPFNPRTGDWRQAFMLALLARAHAHVVSVTVEDIIESPAPGAPPAPVIANLANPTPVPPAPPIGPYVAKLDSSAFFLPDVAQFADSQAGVLRRLAPIIGAWRTGRYGRVTVVGHTARFGPAQGARLLSLQRAMAVADLLRRHGVSVITATGLGYDQPLGPNPQDAANRVVTVTAYPKS